MAHVAVVPDGIALSSGAVFDRRGRYHGLASHDHDFADHPGRLPRRFLPQPHRFLPKIRRLPHDAVALTTSNQDFYFHWLFDVLPRLHLAERAGYGDGPFYVRAELPFQRQSLRMLGVMERCLVDRPGVGAIRAKSLIVPCHHVMPGRVFPEWAIGFLRDRILPQADPAGRSVTRLYISRRKAGHRRLLNEPEVVDLLGEYGFTPIELEDLPFRDQVSLFRAARIVIAPHGGGLANLVFSPPGATVIELFPAANIDLYYRLSTQLRLDYRYVKSGDGSGDAMGSESYRIDPADLKVAVEAVLALRLADS